MSNDEMSLPSGYSPIVQTRQWVVKEEGSVLQATILARTPRTKDEDDDGDFFYELLLERECKVTVKVNNEKQTQIAKVGSIVCIDEFAANNGWKHLTPVGNSGHSVWLKFVKRDLIAGTNKTIWRTEQGSQPRKNVKEVDNIPF